MDLQTRIPEVSRIYKIYASRLEKLGIKTLEDFLYHAPFRYEDYSVVSKISEIQPGEIVTIRGKIMDIKNIFTRRFKIQEAKIADETGEIGVTWFNQPYITKTLKIGDKVSLSGKIELYKNKMIIQSPEFEVVIDNQTIHTGRLVPVYPETRGVSSKWLRRQIFKILNENKDKISDYLPGVIIKQNNLLDLETAFKKIHFPQNAKEAIAAKERLSFDELLFIRISSLLKKKEWEDKSSQKPLEILKHKTNIEKFIADLPFDLTNAQKKVLDEIFKDLSSDKPMNRMLQGEVGSGKTVVAAVAMYLNYLNGNTSILMAPTEILANQHYKTITEFLSKKVRVELITSSSKNKKQADIYVGTHALLHKKEKIKNLRLIVIDEQQRFGVEQRSVIRKKGDNPNLLTMTATPIPRTVALVMYGNLSLSFLNEMPKGRKKVKTWLVPPQKRDNAYQWIGKKIQEGDQVFIICPFIEESESSITVKAATKEFVRLKDEIFSNLKLGILHGKLKSKEKQDVLEQFKNKKIDILVATPVVEVGIDFPNATVMLIEEAERFGLAQLHQLRGRVGRGEKESYCLLFTQSTNPLTLKRLKAMETLNNGAELAELDLKLRGPGQLFGTMQHGVPNLRIANFSDTKLLGLTKREAENIFPELSKHPKLQRKLQQIMKEEVSPD